MQTIYLKKGCKSCLAALVNLYRNPDLSTNIVSLESSNHLNADKAKY